MKKQRKVVWVLVCLALVICLCVVSFMRYRARFASVGDQRFEKSSEQLDLSGQELKDLEVLQEFPGLKQLDLRGTGLTCEEYDRIRGWFPEAEILWDIPFQGAFLPMDTQELTVVSFGEEDLAALKYFDQLRAIDASECPDYPVLDTLRQQWPELELRYHIPVAGSTYSYTADALTLPGESVEELFAVIPLFSDLQTVALTEPLAPIDRILALREAFPEVTFSWQLELGGIMVDEFTENLDLTGIPMTVEQMDAALPYLLNLNYVDMTDCGISNDEMDALNSRYENIKIVWTVDLGMWYRVKTDITSFMPLKDDFYPFGNDLDNLRYCHDVIAVDIGHRRVTNCDWAAYMPHLKYLIIADTAISDLTPLTGLEELVYLEVFLSPIWDYSPLLTLTGLEDLNLCYTRGDPKIIAQMTWLKNLWWGYWEDIYLDYNMQAMLREAIPDCNFCFVTKSSTGMGWRFLPNYYAQRDIFGMHYMTS